MSKSYFRKMEIAKKKQKSPVDLPTELSIDERIEVLTMNPTDETIALLAEVMITHCSLYSDEFIEDEIRWALAAIELRKNKTPIIQLVEPSKVKIAKRKPGTKVRKPNE